MATTAVKDKKAAKKGDDDDDTAKKPSLFKSKKFIIGVVALLGIGYEAYSMFFVTAPVVPPAAGVNVPLDATTVNLASGHFLKIGVTVVLVAGKAALADFEIAEAQQLVITEYSNRTVASLSSTKAFDKSLGHLKAELASHYPDTSCSATDLKSALPLVKARCTLVFDVKITQFVMQ